MLPRGGGVTLDRIIPEQACRIVGIRARGRSRRRMFAMGLVPGARVEMLRTAPLGDPVEYRVRGYCLAIRKADAGLIDVMPEEQ